MARGGGAKRKILGLIQGQSWGEEGGQKHISLLEDERLFRNYGELGVKDRGSEGAGWLEAKYFS